MDWDAIGAIGEVGGALAVVFTLLYLARQLKEHTKSLRIQSLDSTFKEWDGFIHEVQSLERVGGIYRKILANEELTDDEEWEIGFFYRRVFNLYDKLRYLHSIDAADNYNMDSFNRTLPVMINNNFFLNWWPNFKDRYSENCQEYIDKLISATNSKESLGIEDKY